MAGKFRILEKIGNSYRLDLPASMRIHPIFSPDKLRKASNDPLPGQHDEPGEPVVVHEQEEWEVDRILASRLFRGKLKYRVNWKGHDPDLQWYPARNFKGAHMLFGTSIFSILIALGRHFGCNNGLMLGRLVLSCLIYLTMIGLRTGLFHTGGNVMALASPRLSISQSS